MITRVCKSFHFDAAHHLPGYDGPCANNHGHRWKLEVEVTGVVSGTSGFVIDFKELKELVKPLIDLFDHNDLNNILDNPTCENLLGYIWFNLSDQLRGETEGIVKLNRLRLYETPDSYAEVGIDS